MSRVLVTGATGFVGRGTLQPLLDAGFDVHAVTSRSPLTDSPTEVIWHVSDVLDDMHRGYLIEAVRPTHLLHLAWYAEPGKFWDSPLNADWVLASVDLLRRFAKAGGQRVVVAGSCAEYEWVTSTHCVEGVTPLRPATIYGASKNELHEAASAIAGETGMTLAWGRIFFVYGPHEDPRRLVSSIANSVLRGETAETSHGRQLRDFLFAPELGEAFAALTAGDVEGAVNMASGETASIASIATAVAQAAGAPELLALGARPASPSDPDVLSADVSRLQTEVGWTPTLTLEQGIECTVAWWREAIARGLPQEPA